MSAVAPGKTPGLDGPRPSRLARVRRFLMTSGRPEIVWRALHMAALVGTILALINHGPALFTGTMESQRWLQIGLTYIVPYCVATYASTMQELGHQAARSMNGEQKLDINRPQRDYVNTVNKS